MDDLISRQRAIDAITEADVVVLYDKYTPIADAVEIAIRYTKKSVICSVVELPSAESERKRGEWINAYPDIEPNPMFMYGICSVCGFKQSISDKLKYCPNCGTDMRGEE